MMQLGADARASSAPARIDAIEKPSAAEFQSHYFELGKPVLLRGFLKTWPAFGAWSPAAFAERFGDIEVEVMYALSKNSPQDPTPYRQRRWMLMAELAARVGNDHGQEDVYLVAQNQLLRRPAFASLWHDMYFDPSWFTASARERVSLWMGPPGVVTPLHYDLQNALLAQAYGSKLVTFASPTNTPWLYNEKGGYASVDPERPDFGRYPLFRNATLLTAIIEPGDALFLPFGWWHHVRSLTASISLSISNFAWNVSG